MLPEQTTALATIIVITGGTSNDNLPSTLIIGNGITNLHHLLELVSFLGHESSLLVKTKVRRLTTGQASSESKVTSIIKSFKTILVNNYSKAESHVVGLG
jgi:hypothetical protein